MADPEPPNPKGVTDESGLHPRLIDALVCPECRGELGTAPGSLRCGACRLRFPVIDGIPRMAPEEQRRERAGRGLRRG